MKYKLSDICSGITDGSHNPPVGISKSNYLMLSSKNVFDDEITFDDPRYLSEEQYAVEHKRTGILAGDVLMTIVGTVGRTAIVSDCMPPITLQRSVAVLHPLKDVCLSRYLMYVLRSKRNVFESEAHGVAQKGIYLKQLSSIVVEVPEVEKQKKVVQILDQVQRVIKGRQKELSKLDDLIKARFVEMFGDFKINPKGWPVVGFEEIAIIDGNMTTDYERYADHPHIGIDSIEKETGLLKGYRTVAEDGVISGKYVFTSAHIIYSKIRPNLNKVALPDFDGLCSADAYPILPIEGKCNRVFLAYDMRSKFFLDYILQFCNRTNLPKVNRKEVAGFRTPLPPMELQNKFAAFVAQVDKSKFEVQRSLEETQKLFDSLMQEYFS